MSSVNLQLINALQEMRKYPLHMPSNFQPPFPGREIYDGQKLRKILEEAGYQLDPPSEDPDDAEDSLNPS